MMHTSIWFSGRGISSDFFKQCRTVCGWTPKLIDCCVSDSPSSTTALKSLMLLPNLILKKSSNKTSNGINKEHVSDWTKSGKREK